MECTIKPYNANGKIDEDNHFVNDSLLTVDGINYILQRAIYVEPGENNQADEVNQYIASLPTECKVLVVPATYVDRMAKTIQIGIAILANIAALIEDFVLVGADSTLTVKERILKGLMASYRHGDSNYAMYYSSSVDKSKSFPDVTLSDNFDITYQTKHNKLKVDETTLFDNTWTPSEKAINSGDLVCIYVKQ